MSSSRLFEMVYLLLERERIPAPELARRLEVSVRTVYRDAQTLSEAGVPIYAERGRDGGLSILPSFKLNRSLLSEQDKRELLASLRVMEQTGASEGETLRRLTAFLGGESPDWVQIDLSDWSGTQDALIATLRAAILGEQLLSFDYFGEASSQTARCVCPFKLWFKGHAWYLRAYCLSRRGVRTFKLSRMRRPRIVPGVFPEEALAARASDRPDDQRSDPPMISLVLKADARLAFRLFDDFGEEALTPLESGGFLVRASFPPGEWVVSLILGYGEHAEVLEPASLRAEIASRLQKMCIRYQC